MRRLLVAAAAFSTALSIEALAAEPGGPARSARPDAPAPAVKPSRSPGPGAATAGATHYWYDGTARRALRLDPGWIAEFGSPRGGVPAKSRSPLKRSIGGEKALESLPGGSSPVFRDESGAQLALGGGVVVRLREADRANGRERLAAAGLLPVRPIDPDGRTWLVASPPGMASLALANQLHESGRFESAAPNWWRPRALK